MEYFLGRNDICSFCGPPDIFLSVETGDEEEEEVEHPSGSKFGELKINCVTSHPNFSRVQSFPESCKSMQFVPRLSNTARTVLIVVTEEQTCLTSLREAATDRQAAVNKEAAADKGRESMLIFNADDWRFK